MLFQVLCESLIESYTDLSKIIGSYWLSPGLHWHKAEGGHKKGAIQMLKLPEDTLAEVAYSAMFKAGFVRVGVFGGSVYAGGPASLRQKKEVKDLAAFKGLPVLEDYTSGRSGGLFEQLILLQEDPEIVMGRYNRDHFDKVLFIGDNKSGLFYVQNPLTHTAHMHILRAVWKGSESEEIKKIGSPTKETIKHSFAGVILPKQKNLPGTIISIYNNRHIAEPTVMMAKKLASQLGFDKPFIVDHIINPEVDLSDAVWDHELL